MHPTRDCDLVVIGAGAAGMAAALFAAIDGMRVVLLERTQWVGGTSALAAGALWIPNTHVAAGATDTPAKAANYLEHATRGKSPAALRERFLALGPAAVRTLADHTDVQLRAFPYHPDYLSELPDSTTSGRVLECLPFDGRQLGDALRLIRPPIPEFTVLGGMMVDRNDINHLLRMTRSFGSFAHTLKLVARYAMDRLRYPRGARLVLGNALIGRLLLSLRKRNVEIRTGVRVQRLVSESGRVTGVEIESGGGSERIVATRGVVLATGGFGDHAESRARLIPAEVRHTPRAGTSTGALQQQALALGARLSTPESSAAFWAPVSVRKRRDGSTAVFPHFVLDRAKPGTVVVNAAGQRFVNESTSYHRFGEKMLEPVSRGSESVRPNAEAFLIADHRALVKYGLGMVRPGGRGLDAFLRDGYLLRAPTLDDLAHAAKIDARALRATVDRMNRYAGTGADEEFHRGETAYEKNLGDPAFGPNPTLAPLVQPPFYAIRLYPGDIATIAGLVTDADARVLRGDAPIAGLFAIGNDMQSVTAGAYPGPGINLGPAIVFAYAAVKAAQRTARDDGDERTSWSQPPVGAIVSQTLEES